MITNLPEGVESLDGAGEGGRAGGGGAAHGHLGGGRGANDGGSADGGHFSQLLCVRFMVRRTGAGAV